MPSAATRKARAELERWGLLMHADAALPSVTTIVAGEPIRGSWWGHPRGHAIFAVLAELDDSDDATTARLVNGKVTCVHRARFADLIAVGAARARWQTADLSRPARALLRRVDEHGELRTDTLAAAVKKAPAELERRLLVSARQVHTESGAHARVLATWDAWSEAVGVAPAGDVDGAQARFASIAQAWRERFGARVRLPWG